MLEEVEEGVVAAVVLAADGVHGANGLRVMPCCLTSSSDLAALSSV